MRILKRQLSDPASLPHLFTKDEEIANLMKNKKLIVFLDYDGTLTPIVPLPDQAILNSNTRDVVDKLSNFIPVIIISGRDMDVLKNFVQLKNIIYSSCHGFEIDSSEKYKLHYEVDKDALSFLTQITTQINQVLSSITGIQIETKKYSVSVHYRNVEEKHLDFIRQTILQLMENYPQLTLGKGKKILEIRPNVDWHKGKAMLWIINQLQLNPETTCPIYIGDDLTDEDALAVLPAAGIGILVGSHEDKTYASYRLKNPAEVKDFLQSLVLAQYFS